MSNNVKYVLIAVGVVVIIAAILLGLSFERIRYDEYAILKNNFTHKLFFEDKYNESGIFFIGIEKSFIKFPKYLVFNEFIGGSTLNDGESFEKGNKLKVILFLFFCFSALSVFTLISSR
jgi:hypothetical protein